MRRGWPIAVVQYQPSPDLRFVYPARGFYAMRCGVKPPFPCFKRKFQNLLSPSSSAKGKREPKAAHRIQTLDQSQIQPW